MGEGRRTSDGRIVIAHPFGVPVDVTPAWFLVAGLITWVFAEAVDRAVPGLGPWRYAVSLTFALLLYLSVFLHELSHTVVALRSGLPVRRISLHVLGGVSEIERPAETPGREAGIALAGPLVSLLVAAVAFVVAEVLEPPSVARLLARALMVSNLLVGVFNLLPGLPVDGGRVISAVVWRATGRRHTGTVVAGWSGAACRWPCSASRSSSAPVAGHRSRWPTSSGRCCSGASSGWARPRRSSRAGCSSGSRWSRSAP